MIDKDAVHKDLTEAFINYQYRLERAFPQGNENYSPVEMYKNDPMFNRRVRNLVSGVMEILDKHL